MLTPSFVLQVKDAAEKEWDAFKIERTLGVEEINQLRQRVAEEQERKKAERLSRNEPESEDKEMVPQIDEAAPIKPKDDVEMDVDDTTAETKPKEDIVTKEVPAEPEVKEEPAAMQADDDDAVEY
jgi:hypothetical protein